MKEIYARISPLKKESKFPSSKALFFLYVKREKKGHVSFRRCISAVPENLVPLTETQRWSFYCHPHWLFPTFKGRQNLTVPGCCWLLSQANILSRFPYFRWSWKSKRTKPMNSLLNLNNANSKIWPSEYSSFGDRYRVSWAIMSK